MKEGDTALLRAVLERARAARTATTRPTGGWSGPRTTGSTGSTRGEFPDHPWRAHLPAQRAHAQGPDLRADRRAGRRGDHLAARDARRRAQLGLPLHLDARLDVRAVGPVHPRLRLGGQRLLRTSSPTGRRRATATCRSCTASTARRELDEHVLDHLQRLRGRPAGAHRQRRLRPAPARRLGRGARLGLPAHQVARPPRRPGLADAQPAGRARARALARARPRASGRCAASRSTSPPPS